MVILLLQWMCALNRPSFRLGARVKIKADYHSCVHHNRTDVLPAFLLMGSAAQIYVPPEIWTLTFKSVCRHDLTSIARLSVTLNALVLPILYRTLCLLNSEKIYSCIRTLATSRTDIAGMVRTLRIPIADVDGLSERAGVGAENEESILSVAGASVFESVVLTTNSRFESRPDALGAGVDVFGCDLRWRNFNSGGGR